MAIKTFRIEPTNKRMNTQNLSLNYHINGIIRYLSIRAGYRMEEIEPDYENSNNNKAGEFIQFKNEKSQSQKIFHDITFDDEGTGKLDKAKKDAVEIFFAQHPLMLIDGEAHANTVSAEFNIYDMTAQQVDRIISFEDKFAVMTKIMGMTMEEKRDICFYFGVKPINTAGFNAGHDMTDGELNMFLAEPTSGLIVNDSDNMDKFKDVFMNDYPQKEYEVNIQKAILLGIIEVNKEKGTPTYWIGKTLIGSNTNDVQAYFRKEEKLYEDHILPGIAQAEKGGIKAAVQKTAVQVNDIKQTVLEGRVNDTKAAERFELIKECTRLKLAGFMEKTYQQRNAKLPDLIKKVTEAQELERAARKEAAAV